MSQQKHLLTVKGWEWKTTHFASYYQGSCQAEEIGFHNKEGQDVGEWIRHDEHGKIMSSGTCGMTENTFSGAHYRP